jgi:hypothetical protein
MDSNSNGIRFAQFKDWVNGSIKSDLNFQGDLTSAELKTKVSRYVSILSKKGIASPEQLSQCFLVYDWRQPSRGMITRSEFFRSCRIAGFVFTESELRHLSSEFSAESMGSGSHSLVMYKTFLDWCFERDQAMHSRDKSNIPERNNQDTRGSARNPCAPEA